MYEIIKNTSKVDFIKLFKINGPLSIFLAVLALIRVLNGGLDLGVDFKGGAGIQVKFQQQIDLAVLRGALDAKGFFGASVQSIGVAEDHEYLIKVPAKESNLNEVTQSISGLLTQNFQSQGAEIRKTDIVGPKAGSELRTSAFLAMIYSMLAILIYLALRFEFKYAPGAVIALLHDVCLVVGVLSFTPYEFDLQTVAALLAIIGYSVNDTVVIYDRIRENEEKYAGVAFADHINRATNETLSRTILTSAATLMVCIIMYLFGGDSIHGFFFCMSLGIIFGTYSTIYIASPVTLILHNLQRKKSGLKVKEA